MLQGLEQPSISPSPALDNLKPPSTAVLSVKCDSIQQPYDDRHMSHEEDVPAASLTQHINTSSPAKKFPAYTSHRRVNTEVISRPTPLPSTQSFTDQSKTTEDLDAYHTTALTRRRVGEGAKRFSDWFPGKSEPVNVGAMRQTSDEESPMTTSISMERPTGLTQKRMTYPSPLKQVTTPSRFSLFGKRQEQPPEPAEDELLNLDVTAALFPPGSDELEGQEAFNALRNNADTMIKRLQAAYKQRTFALHEANADKNEKQEELEETRTRVGHLKVQLDGMAEKVQEQERAIKAMAEELEQEKQTRQREEEARRHSVMLVKPPEDDVTSDSGAEFTTSKRSSKRASTFTSDSGFESGDESSADSIFSRRDGVVSPTSTVSTMALSPNIPQAALSPPTSNTLQPRREPIRITPQRLSAYDRLKGLASSTFGSNPSKCSICHGVPSSEAWTVLGVLKEENNGLKTRLGELETVVDDCLSLVD